MSDINNGASGRHAPVSMIEPEPCLASVRESHWQLRIWEVVETLGTVTQQQPYSTPANQGWRSG